MKRMLIILLILLLSACNDNPPVEELKEKYPKIKEVAEQFPQSVQEKLAAPTVFPFEPKNVSLTYAGDMPGDPTRDILHTEFIYGDGVGVNLHVTTYHNKNSTWATDEKAMKTVELKDGTKALIDGDGENVKQIRWKKDGIYYSIMLIKAPKIKKEYTIEDVVKTANSMEY
ncbi:hypothetical protein [Fictibacillus arsenicus]|nr:hypothetical protein [Fictibacillus arsenicus]